MHVIVCASLCPYGCKCVEAWHLAIYDFSRFVNIRSYGENVRGPKTEIDARLIRIKYNSKVVYFMHIVHYNCLKMIYARCLARCSAQKISE